MAASGSFDRAGALRRQANEPKSWLKPGFAAATSGCTVELSTNAAGETDVLQPTIVVPGPAEYMHNGVARPSPFAGRSFRVKVQLSEAYPFTGPQTGDIVFVDIPFHPNIMPDGNLCCEGLAWKPVKALKHIAQFIQAAVAQPNPEHSFNPDAGKILSEDVEAFEARARTGDKRAA